MQKWDSIIYFQTSIEEKKGVVPNKGLFLNIKRTLLVLVECLSVCQGIVAIKIYNY